MASAKARSVLISLYSFCFKVETPRSTCFKSQAAGCCQVSKGPTVQASERSDQDQARKKAACIPRFVYTWPHGIKLSCVYENFRFGIEMADPECDYGAERTHEYELLQQQSPSCNNADNRKFRAGGNLKLGCRDWDSNKQMAWCDVAARRTNKLHIGRLIKRPSLGSKHWVGTRTRKRDQLLPEE